MRFLELSRVEFPTSHPQNVLIASTYENNRLEGEEKKNRLQALPRNANTVPFVALNGLKLKMSHM